MLTENDEYAWLSAKERDYLRSVCAGQGGYVEENIRDFVVQAAMRRIVKIKITDVPGINEQLKSIHVNLFEIIKDDGDFMFYGHEERKKLFGIDTQKVMKEIT